MEKRTLAVPQSGQARPKFTTTAKKANPLATSITSTAGGLQPARLPQRPAWSNGRAMRGTNLNSIVEGQASNFSPSSLASALQSVDINGTTPQNAKLNPSKGPPRTLVPQGYRGDQTQFTRNSYDPIEKPINNHWCIRTDRRRRDFHVGDVIALPYHTPNTNPRCQEGDDRLRATCEGPVYSKRRMFVVLWITKQHTFCLPLFSFSNRGIIAKHEGIRDEFVEMVNESAKATFVPKGDWPPVAVVVRKDG